MYGLKCALVDADGRRVATSGEDNPGVQDAKSDVVVGVTFLRKPGQVVANIWVVEKAKVRKESAHVTVSVDSSDAPTLLAIRAADVLRAAVLNWNRSSEAQTRATDSTSRAVANADSGAHGSNGPRAGFDRWTVGAGAVMIGEAGALGLGFAPAIQIAARLNPRLALALSFTGPASGQAYVAPLATARVRLELATFATALRLLEHRQFSLDIIQSIGGAHFSVRGEAAPPWIAQRTSAWAMASTTGTSAALAMSDHFALNVGLAALFVLPQPVVDVAQVSYRVQQPLLFVNIGINYGF